MYVIDLRMISSEQLRHEPRFSRQCGHGNEDGESEEAAVTGAGDEGITRTGDRRIV
jgi:hypothetical protein